MINIPTFDLVDEVIGIGNCHGSEVNKFEKFALTPVAGKKVSAPLIAECYANFECKLIDTSLIKKYSLFVFEVVLLCRSPLRRAIPKRFITVATASS